MESEARVTLVSVGGRAVSGEQEQCWVARTRTRMSQGEPSPDPTELPVC